MDYHISMKIKEAFLVGIIGCTLFCSNIAIGQSKDESEQWIAPKTANNIENKYTSTTDIEAGKQTFNMYCWTCHGKEGLGDGPAGVNLPFKPRNFTDNSVKEQTDGALYWKLTNGRGNMIGYGGILPDEKRWQLISYIRTLNTNSNNKPAD